MTGWYPHVRGHRSLRHLLQPDEPNLLKYLKQAGYHVWWGGGHNDVLSEASFKDSVSEFYDSDGFPYHGDNPYDVSDPRYHSFLHAPFDGHLETHGDMRMVNRAVDFIRSKPSDPFVVYLPLINPHCPYSAPREWHEMYDAGAIPDLRPVDEDNRPSHHRLIRSYRRLNQVDEFHFKKIHAVYLGMVSFVDFLLGQILDALDQSGQAEDTCILLFSDHGDYAGDYGLVEKWPNAFEDILTRVPLIIRMPGGQPGHVVSEPVELFDIMATVLDLAQINAQHTHFSQSLLPQLQGATGNPQRYVFAEGGYDPREPHCSDGYPGYVGSTPNPLSVYSPKHRHLQEEPDSAARTVMIRSNDHKLIHRSNGEHELYDYRTDPQESRNLINHADYQPLKQQLRDRLLDWYLRTSDITPFEADPRGLPDNSLIGQSAALTRNEVAH